MKKYCCENWEYCDESPEECPIAQRNKAFDDFNNAKEALINFILEPFAEENIKKTIEIIMLVLWILVGLWFLISPLPITKFEFGGCWVSLLCFILLNMIEMRDGKND